MALASAAMQGSAAVFAVVGWFALFMPPVWRGKALCAIKTLY
jgi:hypothetical protein